MKNINFGGTVKYSISKSLKVWIVSFISISFIFFSVYYCKIPLNRVFNMFPPLAKILSMLFFPPDSGYLTNVRLLNAIWETFQMSILASILGTIFAIPLAWFAAYNMTPNKLIIYPLSRLIISASRSINIIIWAIIFVHIFGFGPFAGILALTLLTIGFETKLFSEEIETIKVGPVEAMQATGAGKLKVMYYGVFPQIKTAWIGIAIYNWDGVFRAATIIGYVGTGGIGTYLREQIGFMNYPKAGAIIIAIIVLVIASEIISAYFRKKTI